jgi:arginase
MPFHAEGPLVEVDDVVVLGPRDEAELASAATPSIADRVHMVSAADLHNRDLRDVGSRAVTHLRDQRSMWWLHIDLDVLTTDALPAVDYPQPGGLSWIQLEDLSTAALSVGGCLGASVVIYNPDLDGGAYADRIVAFVEQLTALIWGQYADQG